MGMEERQTERGWGSPRLRQVRTNSAGGQEGLECFKEEEEEEGRQPGQDREGERGLEGEARGPQGGESLH